MRRVPKFWLVQGHREFGRHLPNVPAPSLWLHGVLVVSIDTDLQFAFTEGIRDYMTKNIEYLKTQIGNPEGADVPNKKHYDPRKWLRESEITFNARLEQAFADLNNVNTL